MADPIDGEVRLLVIGKTSIDNDSTLNQILGRPGNYSSEWRIPNKVTCTSGTFQGKYLSVVNTPGLMDIRESKETPEDIKAEITKFVAECEKGFNAVLVVTSYPIRWTIEETETSNYIREIVKDDNLRKFGVLVVTNGKGITRKGSNYEEIKQYFHSYLQEQKESSQAIKDYLGMFEERCIFLDTESGQDENKQQLDIFGQLLKTKPTFFLPNSGMTSLILWDLICRIWCLVSSTASHILGLFPSIPSITGRQNEETNPRVDEGTQINEEPCEMGFTSVTIEKKTLNIREGKST